MKDRINVHPESSDDWSTYISELAHNQEFGSVGFEAIHDFYNLQILYKRLSGEHEGSLDLESGKADLTPEERRGIVLERISLLEHTIEQKEGKLEGYANVTLQIRDGFDSMLSEAKKEAKTTFPDNQSKQAEHVQSVYGKTMSYVLTSIVEKQKINLVD